MQSNTQNALNVCH